MTVDERKILYIQEYLYQQEYLLESDLKESVYNVCIKKKWNADNFNKLYQAYCNYRAFQKVSFDLRQILNL